MKTSGKLLIIVFFFITGILFLGSSKAQTKILTMEEAVSRALAFNNQVLASNYVVDKANWDTKQAWAQLFPTLRFNSRYMWIDEQTYAERDFRRYLPPELADQMPQTVFQESYFSSLDAEMPLFNGILLNGISIANANVEMAEQMNRSTKQNIIFQVIRGYLEVLKSKDVQALQEEYLELSRLNCEKAERLFNADRYSKNESLRWKVDYEQQKSVVVGSKTTLRSNLTVLSRLINDQDLNPSNLEVSLPAELNDVVNKFLAMTEDDILELINLSNDQLEKMNAQLAAGKANTEISKLLYKNTYSDYMPKVTATYSYGWRENGTFKLDDYSPKTFMVNLSIPIFTSFQNFTNVKSKYYEYKESEEKYKDQLLNTKYVLTEIINRLINLKTQKTLSETSLEYSENNYNIVEKQKERGLVSNIDFIDAKLNYQNAKLNKLSINYDLISTIVELHYLLGKVETILN